MSYDPKLCVCGCPKNNHAMNMNTLQCSLHCNLCPCEKYASA